MPLVLSDTRSRETRAFVPVVPGKATVYVCGPTVQAPPHVGHVRSAVAFDILRRWLAESGYDVTYARNVTDIDDKIIHVAGHEGVSSWAVAERNTRAFNAAYDALGNLAPTVEPRATGHVPEMIDLMRTLIDKGHAYASGGDVYFDVRSFDRYGELSGQVPDQMIQTEKVDPTRPKRSPLDFALWKAHKPGEPFWDTPWGPGRPGWHLECSAMAVKYLGQPFDIHGGGLDLVFPHHESERAIGEAWTGKKYCNYYLHNGFVTVDDQKMSKSLGNFVTIRALLERHDAEALRVLLLSAPYRASLDYSEKAIEAATRRVERWRAQLAQVREHAQAQAPAPAQALSAQRAAFWAAL
ncbi:MAG TPA: cysteine--tRNA ligase, partial [Frankiaceae bacterium]|nr:cysteine--tRNA ligase [Frankiaceae bacterium]